MNDMMPAAKYSHRRCPVCWRKVRPTMLRNIETHWDSLGDGICPGGGEPYRITIPSKPNARKAAA